MEINPYLSREQRAILANARIGIAGAGGLGSNCAMHLVRSGIRHLVIADFDRVSESNLNRQFFFADQIGRKKVEALGVNLLRIVPELDLELLAEEVTGGNAVTLFGACDIVIEAFDSAAAKQMLIRTMTAAGSRVRRLKSRARWAKRNEAIHSAQATMAAIMMSQLQTWGLCRLSAGWNHQ